MCDGRPEDELLVKLAQVPKGCRMLARVIPLLSQAQVVYIVYAFIRNLHYILTAPKTKDVRLTPLVSCVVLCVSCVSCACAVACVSCRVGRLTPNGRTSRR